MTAVFKKLNFKGQKRIYILNAPSSFESELEAMRIATEVVDALAKAKDVAFVMIFATKQKEVDDFAGRIAKVTASDAIVWIAYPKGTSKNYKCEFHRDNGWAQMGVHGFEPVRMVAIDHDWSALRFRRVEHIETMTRSSAITEAGKKRIAKA